MFGTDNTVHNMCASAVYMRVRSKYRIKVYFRIVSYSLLACLFMLFSASSFPLFTSSHLDFPGSFSLRLSFFLYFFFLVFFTSLYHTNVHCTRTPEEANTKTKLYFQPSNKNKSKLNRINTLAQPFPKGSVYMSVCACVRH